MKSKDELLRKRYLVIAESFRDELFTKGEVLELEFLGQHKNESYKHFYLTKTVKKKTFRESKYLIQGINNNNSFGITEYSLKKYPHLFRELDWHEFRDENDMPEYVKAVSDFNKEYYIIGEFLKVRGWYKNDARRWLVNFINIPNQHTKYHHAYDFEPATETEYLEYLKTKA